uniref:Uncharacterized protein n=1 Tax=Timema bartmani TaxID=61472 RepID=A0A7R9F8I5_9NEOP|nr:unnamed protein product [Timema bartmani]
MDREKNISFDFNQICRFCLSQGGVMSAIFDDDGENSTISLPSKIMACASVQLSCNDGLPTLICHRCLYQAERSYEFKLQCEDADSTLREYVNRQGGGQGVHIKQERMEEDGSDDESSPLPEMHVQAELSLGAKENERQVCSLNGCEITNGGPEPYRGITPSYIAFNSSELQSMGVTFPSDLCATQIIVNERDIDSVVVVVDPSNCDLDEEDEVVKTLQTNNKTIPKKKSESKIGRPHACGTCSKTFSQRAHLTRHELVHTGKKPYGCTVCGKSFADSSTLTTHFRTHTGERPFPCDTCPKAFASRSDLRKHAFIHSGLRPHVCQVCSKSFTRSTNLRKHARVHSGLKPFRCAQCTRGFSAKGDLARHMLVHSGDRPHVCEQCCVSFSRRDKLNRHMRKHELEQQQGKTPKLEGEEDAPGLGHLGEFANLTDNIQMKKEYDSVDGDDESRTDANAGEMNHVDSSPDNTKSKTIIDIPDDLPIPLRCGSSVSVHKVRMDQNGSQNALKLGKMFMNKKKISVRGKFYCNICHKTYTDPGYFKIHQQIHTGVRNHQCSMCDKAFFRRRELLRHEKVHTGDKPYACEICSKCFSRRDKLTRHIKVHTERRMFVCNECPAQFLRREELSRHTQCHTGERPHCCPTCYKTFPTRAELTRHSATHAEVKPFQCDRCSMSFCRKDKLTRHQKTHIDKPYSCGECSISFSVKEAFEKHVYVHHWSTMDAGSNGPVDGMDSNSDSTETTKQEDTEFSLSRLGKNPEILLFPIPRK